MTSAESEAVADDDLMTFTETSQQLEHCMSLESFDPLFSMDTISADNSTHSNLFTASAKQGQQTADANPFTARGGLLTTQDILDKVNAMSQPAKHYNKIDTDQLEAQIHSEGGASNEAVTKDHKRNISTGSELLNPFDISDLTVMLEKKRQAHAHEQERRKAALQVAERAAAADVSKPKVTSDSVKKARMLSRRSVQPRKQVSAAFFLNKVMKTN